MTAPSSPKISTKKVKRLEAFESKSFIYLGVILVIGFILAYLLHMPAPGQSYKKDDPGTITGRVEGGQQVTIPFTLDMLRDEFAYSSTNDQTNMITVTVNHRDRFVMTKERYRAGLGNGRGVATVIANVFTGEELKRDAKVSILLDDLKTLAPDTPDTITMTIMGRTLVLPYSGVMSNAKTISLVVDEKGLVALNTFLWILELGLYIGLAWHLTRHPFVATAALFLGVAIRYLFVLTYNGIFSAMDHTDFLETLAYSERNLWIYQLLNMAVVGGLFALPLKNYLKTGFNYKMKLDLDDESTKPSAQQVPANKFSFAPKQTQVADIKIRKAPKPSANGEQGVLTPPEDFVRPEAARGVHGTITVPRKVIIASVPEAENFLRSDKPIPVQLSMIVPQLKRATVWLTWQQVFDTGNTDPSMGNPYMDDPDLYDRWIRIPAKYYALQVPEQFYTKDRTNNPAWMQQPHVPQEEQFDLEQEHV